MPVRTASVPHGLRHKSKTMMKRIYALMCGSDVCETRKAEANEWARSLSAPHICACRQRSAEEERVDVHIGAS